MSGVTCSDLKLLNAHILMMGTASASTFHQGDCTGRIWMGTRRRSSGVVPRSPSTSCRTTMPPVSLWYNKRLLSGDTASSKSGRRRSGAPKFILNEPSGFFSRRHTV